LLRIRYRILLVVGVTAALGQIATAEFYARHHEQTVMAQHELAMKNLTDSVNQSVQSVMLAGSAEIAQAFAARLKRTPEVLEFRIIRSDGMEAFGDNKTILEVNKRRGDDVFALRDQENQVKVMEPLDSNFQHVLRTENPVSIYAPDSHGNPTLTFLAPILNSDICHKCHGKANPVRGVIRLTTSMAATELDILKSRQLSLVVLFSSLAITLLLVSLMLGRIVIRPIETVTRAMGRIAEGDLDHKVAVTSHDEIGRMAINFNLMTDELRNTYLSLRREQDKLTTVIESASEGIVVTDTAGEVVMANTAAAQLLDKSNGSIVDDGFLALVDDPALIRGCIETSGPIDVKYKDRTLQIHASVISDANARMIGSVAMIRDISAEKQLEHDLRRLSTTDALTNLFNRRFLDQTLDAEFVRARRSHGAISLIMFDIDHFKKFNDTHGHDQGDRVLQMVARCLRENVRSFDFPCRYGGEEYVAILPGLSPGEALEMAERLRVAVAETEVDGLHVHISLGVSSYPRLDLDSGTALLEAADAALYIAKESGRNRVVMAEAKT
jgi:diguanylate cyclase (GGDEF)-like protein